MHRICIDWCEVSENYTTLIYCLRGALPLTSNCSKLYNIHGLRIGLCKFCACCITCICWYNWWNSDDASWNLKQNQHYLDLRHISGTATKFCKIVNLRRSTRFWRIRFWFVGSGKCRHLFILDGKMLKAALIMCEMRRQGLKNLWHFSVPKCSIRYSITIKKQSTLFHIFEKVQLKFMNLRGFTRFLWNRFILWVWK